MSKLSFRSASAGHSIRELSTSEVNFVAGAGELNPQPLPPGPGDRFGFRSFSSLLSAHSFSVASILNRSFVFYR